jgi:hypothetical protein
MYFFLTSPTGQTSNIVDSDRVRKTKFQKLVDNDSLDGRLFRITYEVYKPIVITMVCIRTRLGTRRSNEQVLIEVGDTDAPALELIGAHGFGKFVGHAVIDPSQRIPDGMEVRIVEGSKDEGKEKNLGLIW